MKLPVASSNFSTVVVVVRPTANRPPSGVICSMFPMCQTLFSRSWRDGFSASAASKIWRGVVSVWKRTVCAGFMNFTRYRWYSTVCMRVLGDVRFRRMPTQRAVDSEAQRSSCAAQTKRSVVCVRTSALLGEFFTLHISMKTFSIPVYGN